MAQISDKLEKERLRKARLEAAGAAQQPQSPSLTINTLPGKQMVSESQSPPKVPTESQVSSGVQCDEQLPSKTEVTRQEGDSIHRTDAKQASRKPDSGSHDTAEPMETESGGQVSERGQPMEAEQSDTTRQKPEIDNTGEFSFVFSDLNLL